MPLELASCNVYKQLNPESVNAVVLPDRILHVCPYTGQYTMILYSNADDPDRIVRISFIFVSLGCKLRLLLLRLGQFEFSKKLVVHANDDFTSRLTGRTVYW